LKGYATLPTGERKGLIWIKDWDFKWQGDYRYANSVWLPKGSRITLDYTYDNSAHNVRNPYQPPRRVRFGLQSADEMGELYFQILPRDLHDFEVLAKDFSQYFRGVSRDFYRFRVAANPNDAEAHKRLGRILGGEGAVDEAIAHLTEAIRLDPGADEPHYDLGGIYLRQGGLADAYREFSEVVRLNPNDFEAFGSLGIICLRAARNQEAEVRFEQALHINPQDGLARKYLDALRARR
jgi:tetratricopeptide (TPR) repeat protein